MSYEAYIPTSTEIVLRFVRSEGLTSDAIAWREGTVMPFVPSHVECVTPEGKWLGQHIDGGMLARPAGYDQDQVALIPGWGLCELFVKLPCTLEQHNAFYEEAKKLEGQPYDWRAIIGFGVTFHEHEKFHSICSAIMTQLLRDAADWFPSHYALVVPFHCIDPRDLLLMVSVMLKVQR
jgi:hypothetical protein